MVRAGIIVWKILRGEDRAEKKPRAQFARDQIGVLALPAQSRRLGQRLFHHRGSVYEHLDLAAGVGDQPSAERLQPLLDYVVIVVASRIDRDRAARALLQDRQRIFIRSIIDPEHHDGAYVRPQHARIGAALRVGREPVHVAMRARFDEGVKMTTRVADAVGRGYTEPIEAERAGFGRERQLQLSAGQTARRLQKSRST